MKKVNRCFPRAFPIFFFFLAQHILPKLVLFLINIEKENRQIKKSEKLLIQLIVERIKRLTNTRS